MPGARAAKPHQRLERALVAATRSGRRSLSFSVNRQLAPDATRVDAPEAFAVLRRDYALAVCALLK